MKLTRELKTAIIVLGGILLFILGFTYLKSSSLFSNGRKYFAVYDNVGGIAIGTPILINGYQVGTIKDIRFIDGEGNLLVTLIVDSEFQFSKNSTAEIYDTGIIGGKSIRIIPEFDNSEMAKSGDTLISAIKPGLTELVTQKLTPLQEKIERMIVSTDSVLVGMDQVMDEESRENLRETIGNLNHTVANFKSASYSLDNLLTNNKEKLNNTIGNVNKVSNNLAQLSDTLAQANLGSTINELEQTITKFNSMMTQMQEGEGSLGKLMKDEALYKNISEASGQLGLLLEDMRLNPKRYVHFSLFGKKQKPYEGPIEEQN
ncbi:phospholipid/cholesterol/gamma-HCH transport system substrate-binding protein [Zhouia amylolytica]|uniref:Phospholipid/cholesterol/gamma-HCH transport system substrate-binding protein n=1 Tax=Zhouia amylolytica TaxID=376730 RepID=A0A1I6VK33_9FLAO|nr:MlaD family protein [Zhouia amylolytica]SFT13991.1 phospholipid/cholesterol/gamma-HCH transport system substrate-binding protein [Zhouia amylolytica]